MTTKKAIATLTTILALTTPTFSQESSEPIHVAVYNSIDYPVAQETIEELIQQATEDYQKQANIQFTITRQEQNNIRFSGYADQGRVAYVGAYAEIEDEENKYGIHLFFTKAKKDEGNTLGITDFETHTAIIFQTEANHKRKRSNDISLATLALEHELSHTLGVQHCYHKDCLMNRFAKKTRAMFSEGFLEILEEGKEKRFGLDKQQVEYIEDVLEIEKRHREPIML